MAKTLVDEGEAPVIVGLVAAAIELHSCAMGSLPAPDATAFLPRAEAILSGLRKAHTFLEEAAGRARTTPAVMVALGEVRGRYDDLMTKAAAAPGSSLGQQLYAARRRAQLSIQEIATGLGLRADLIEALEAGEPASPHDEVTVKELIAALTRSPDPVTLDSAPLDSADETGPESDESAAWGESAF